MYNLRKDIKQFTRRVRLWGYLYLDEEVDGDFSNVYTPLDENTTEAMVQEINERIQESFNKGNIEERTRDYRLASKDARPGGFYLLPTLHKQGVPGRPVISGFSTPTKKISEFVDLLIAETFGTKHRVIH